MINIEQLGVVGYGEVGKTFAAGLRPRVQGLYVADLKLQDPAQAPAMQSHAQASGALPGTLAMGLAAVTEFVAAPTQLATAGSKEGSVKAGWGQSA